MTTQPSPCPPFTMLRWSTDDHERPIALINGKRYENAEVIRLHAELGLLLAAEAQPDSVAALPVQPSDAQMLDWLDKNWGAWCGVPSVEPGMYYGTNFAERTWVSAPSIREAIRAAMVDQGAPHG